MRDVFASFASRMRSTAKFGLIGNNLGNRKVNPSAGYFVFERSLLHHLSALREINNLGAEAYHVCEPPI